MESEYGTRGGGTAYVMVGTGPRGTAFPVGIIGESMCHPESDRVRFKNDPYSRDLENKRRAYRLNAAIAKTTEDEMTYVGSTR